MKRLLGQAFAVTTFGMLAAALTPACADNDQSIFVINALGPPQNRTNGQCVYQPDPTQLMLSGGTLDVGLKSTYGIRLLMASQLIGRGDALSGRSESNRIHLNGAVVRLTDANGGAIAEYTSLGSGFIDIQLNNVAAYGLLFVDAIDSTRGRQLREELPARFASRQVVANVKAFGKTLGGTDVESGEFQFPITVCNGCLVAFPEGSDDPALTGADCLAPVADSNTQAVVPCSPGQDEPLSCRSCQGLEVCNPPQ